MTSKMPFTVISYDTDQQQKFADFVMAVSPQAAEAQVYDGRANLDSFYVAWVIDDHVEVVG